jgi:hypothetical protein
MLTRRSLGATAVAAAGFTFALAPAKAQAFPRRPIKLVVPSPAGGASDFVFGPWVFRQRPRRRCPHGYVGKPKSKDSPIMNQTCDAHDLMDDARWRRIDGRRE